MEHIDALGTYPGSIMNCGEDHGAEIFQGGCKEGQARDAQAQEGDAEERAIGQDRQEPEAGHRYRPFGSAQGRKKGAREEICEKIRKEIPQSQKDNTIGLIRRGGTFGTTAFYEKCFSILRFSTRTTVALLDKPTSGF
jgi:hypothetical protein